METMKSTTSYIIGLGEALWDVLPDGIMPANSATRHWP